MKWDFITGMLKSRPQPATRLLAVTPPRTGERTLLEVENLLSSIAVPEPFSLEIAGDAAGVTLLAPLPGGFLREATAGRPLSPGEGVGGCPGGRPPTVG